MNDPNPSAGRVIEVFNEAKARPAGAEREGFLEAACGTDANLRAEVDQLLSAHEEAGSFLRAVAAGATESVADFAPLKPEEAGERIGHYKLLQQIGEGGFGTVWMAEQTEPVKRRVALKIIKLGMDTREVIARFDQERQALAIMDHPNIARVLDAGATPAGRPFFVMELVRGIRITEYCDQANLPTAERLQLFIAVCQAAQHAHQKGIIHRDLKPSNILVTLHDGVPVPKVIDFGVAKATQSQRLTELTFFTQFQQMIGTPLYMSPEQAEMSGLDIDTRSDIYSLGVLLYELLVGRTPFDPERLMKAGYDEMRRVIREEEPPKPSTALSTMQLAVRSAVAQRRQVDAAKMAGLLRGDLDWIVMKAMEKDRTRRYETASAFAQDVRRFLADEPVTAAAPSRLYRFRKFTRRNRTALGVGASIAAILVIATIASAWQAIRATAERDAKEQARQEAEGISTFLTEVFQSPDPARDGRTITVAETLDRAVKKLETDLAGQPERQANLRAALGRTYYVLGLYRNSIALFEKVRDYRLATVGREHPETLLAMDFLASSYGEAGRLDEAQELREEALALYRKVLGPQHASTLAAMNNLAASYFAAGRREEALKLYEEALALYRKVLGPEHPSTLAAMSNLATSFREAGRRKEALELREEVLALYRKVPGPEHPNMLVAMGNLASSYLETGRRKEAIELQEEVLTLSRKSLGPEHPGTFSAMRNLAYLYHRTGRREEALKLREEVLELRRRVSGPEHSETLRARLNLAESYGDAGRRNEALKLREEVLALYRKVSGQEHPDTLMAMKELANSYGDAGRRDEALKLREEVLALYRKVSGPEHPDTLGAMLGLAISYGDAGRRDEALKLREEVLALYRKVLGPDHLETLIALHDLATSYGDAGRRDEALKLREEVLAMSRNMLGPQHPTTLAAMTNLSNSYGDARRRAEALKLREEALALLRKVIGPEHPDTLIAMRNLASSYGDAGRRDEALKLREETLAISRKVLGPQHPTTLAEMSNLSVSYGDASRWDEAVKLREEVLAISRKVSGPEHPDTLIAMHNLAFSYGDAGRRDEALALREELLALRIKVSGSEHLETLMAMRNLANSYGDVGRRDEALKLREELLSLRRKVSGPEHPETLGEMNNLAVSYGDAGRGDEALKLREEVLALSRKVKGPEHPDALMAMRNLAISYHDAGRRDEVLKLREEVLALRRKVNGPEHPETLQAMHDLALSYHDARRRDEAIELRKELLRLRRKVNGPEHPETLEAMHDLALSYHDAGRRDEALELREELLALYREVHGPDHPDTLETMEKLAFSYHDAGRWDEALPLLAELSARRPKDSMLAQRVTTLQAWFGKDAEHAATCHRILEQAAGTDDPSVADRAAKAYCLRPSTDPQAHEAARKLARHSVELGKNHQYLPYYQLALGMAEYRAANYSAADEALTAAAHGGSKITARLFHAMSLFRQGKEAEARKLFNGIATRVKPLPDDERRPFANGASPDDLIVWLAYKEAKALLQSEAKAGEK